MNRSPAFETSYSFRKTVLRDTNQSRKSAPSDLWFLFDRCASIPLHSDSQISDAENIKSNRDYSRLLRISKPQFQLNESLIGR